MAEVDARTDGLPPFVVNEFRKFLRCGVLAHGLARVRCGDCAFERLVPFSCKGRGVCPRFGGAVNLHVHFHTLVLDGVFVRDGNSALCFHPAAPPTDVDVERVVARVRRRLVDLRLTGSCRRARRCRRDRTNR